VTRIIDASVVVAALVDGGETGRWAETMLLGDHLAAPYLMPSEVASILRRSVLAGELSPDAAKLAHVELVTLPVDLFAYAPVASRAWDLRENFTMYDAWYVALAELLDADLATLDTRMARAPNVECRFLTPESESGD
jgi:predicted nucleic acid-binding protein